MDVGMHKVDVNIKPPEFVISSGYDPIKREETDNEDMYNDINTSNVQQSINVLSVKVKEEDDISTDDERSPEYVSSSSRYDPIKSEETDDEETGRNISISNEQHLPIKEESNDNSTDDGECISSERRQRMSPRLLTKHTAQPNVSNQDVSIQSTKKKRRYSGKLKREVEESSGSVQKAARVECSVEGCTRKAAGNGRCRAKHGGQYVKTCSYDGCTKAVKNGGVCHRHGAIARKRTCTHDGCKDFYGCVYIDCNRRIDDLSLPYLYRTNCYTTDSTPGVVGLGGVRRDNSV